MREIGIDMSDQKPKGVETYPGKVAFERVIVVCGHAERNCPQHLRFHSARLLWPFEDPAAAIGSREGRRSGGLPQSAGPDRRKDL